MLARFRTNFYTCLSARADALFELTDAVLCTDGPVKTLVGLAPAPERRRGHGALYDALGRGRIDVVRLRRTLASLPRAADGRLVLAVDVTPWLRPDAATSPDRSFCHTYGRGRDEHRMIPGWPCSIVAALEPGRTSWTALLDAQRLQPGADVAAVTAVQVREMGVRALLGPALPRGVAFRWRRPGHRSLPVGSGGSTGDSRAIAYQGALMVVGGGAGVRVGVMGGW